MGVEYDLIILGGGTGGYVSAIRAAQLGLKVAIVEKEKLGGTCLHQGCIPSKALLRSAEVFVDAKNMGSFGINVSDVTIDFQKVQERKAMTVEKLYKSLQYLLQKRNIDIFEGQGEIIDSHQETENRVDIIVHLMSGETKELSSRNLIIATGSAPKGIPGIVLDGDKVINSDQALQMTTLPASIIIIGGGVIGIEWASLLSDFGVQVTVIESMEQILPLEDHDISKELQRIMKKKKIKFNTGALVRDIFASKDGVTVSVELKGNTKEISAEKVLLSIGRKANVDGIGLERAGIEVKNNVIHTNKFYQTSVHHIYAIGDVIGGLQLAHVASHEGIIAVEHIANKNPKPMDYNLVPKCVYTHPQIASIGLTEQEAIDHGFSITIGKFPFSAIGKALVYGETNGFAKMIIDETTNKILGVHMLGPNVTDLISEASLAKLYDATNINFASIIRPHPSLSEIFTEVALESKGEPIHI